MVSTDAIVVYGFQIEDGSDEEERCLAFLDTDEKAFEKLQKLNVELREHCSDKCPMYILALDDVGEIAHRGYPVGLRPEELLSLDRTKSDAVLAKGARLIGIEPRPGRWLLCSHWDPSS
jgi:hypothetical protein